MAFNGKDHFNKHGQYEAVESNNEKLTVEIQNHVKIGIEMETVGVKRRNTETGDLHQQMH